jgi:hypothetical protein
VSAAAARSSAATLNIANFGAVPSSAEDSASVFDAAIAAAQTPSKVVSTRFYASNSSITVQFTGLRGGGQIFIDECSFYAANKTEANIHVFRTSNVAIYNNTAQNLDPNPTAQDVLTGGNARHPDPYLTMLPSLPQC